MKLSIILVNYNVRYFLEQAISSIYSSNCTYPYEIFVVDNASTDDSISMLNTRFSEVNIIANDENLGFSKANNQAIAQSRGEYILLLNPDTILREDSLQKSLDYMETHEKCGGLGIRMIDGSGNFLPESKRGLPTPLTAFYRMTGIASAFPRSRHFNAYHQGHISEHESHKVEILAGAYMMMRKSVLDEIGYLDEDFFMYGEDIDISYRILKAGYYNYYLADSEIIHFKGESTRKASFNYIKTFHKAMIQFAQKHFNAVGGLNILFLRLGIYIKAIVSLIHGWAERFGVFFLDFILLWLVGYGIQEAWEIWYYGVSDFYTTAFVNGIIPISIIVLLGIAYLFGAYDLPLRFRKLLRGAIIGMICVLAFYGLLGENFRSSRVVIGLTAVSSIIVLPLIRATLNLLKHRIFTEEYKPGLRYAIVGKKDKIDPIQEILQNHNQDHEFIGRIGVRESSRLQEAQLGNVEDIEAIVHAHDINEIYFCTSDISRRAIMEYMSAIGSRTKYRIVEEADFHILGSDSKNLRGKLYTRKVHYKVSNPENRRWKRIIDLTTALFLLLLYPVSFFLFQHPGDYFNNIMHVLLGKKTWIAYNNASSNLPHLKAGILNTEKVYENSLLNVSSATDQLYARDYSVWLDITTLLRNLMDLDGSE